MLEQVESVPELLRRVKQLRNGRSCLLVMVDNDKEEEEGDDDKWEEDIADEVGYNILFRIIL